MIWISVLFSHFGCGEFRHLQLVSIIIQPVRELRPVMEEDSRLQISERELAFESGDR